MSAPFYCTKLNAVTFSKYFNKILQYYYICGMIQTSIVHGNDMYGRLN